MTYHFAIIGGGIGGLAAGIFLLRAGHRVTILERFNQPQSVGAGVLVQPTGMQVLRELGLLTAVETGSARVDSLIGHNHKGRRIMDVRYSDVWPGIYGLGVHRGLLFSQLYRAVLSSDIELITDCEVESIEQTAQGPLVKTSRQQSYSGFDAVVIANGTQSALRSHLPVKQRYRPYPWGALWAICADPQHRFGGALQQRYHHASMMLGVLPTGPHPETGVPSVSLFWSLKSSEYPEWLTGDFAAWKEQLLSYWPEIETLLEPIEDHAGLTFAHYGDVVMRQWHHDCVVCLGDAAHGMSPQLGQGVNLALLDARVLSRCIEQTDNLPQAFRQYSKQRRRHLRYYQWASRWLTPLFQSDLRWAAWLRDWTFPKLHYIPYVNRQAVRTVAGVKTGLLLGRGLPVD